MPDRYDGESRRTGYPISTSSLSDHRPAGGSGSGG